VRAAAADDPTSITDASAASRIVRLVTVLAVLTGAGAAWYYASAGLTLSHYDSRGHLIVARRVVDSLTPGWQQLGAIWLPLPHVLNALPVQWDWAHRTGWSGVTLSIGAMALGLGAFAGYLFRATGSRPIAVALPFLILLNPNVFYLQSTPMTEPLLFGLALLAVASMDGWLHTPSPGGTLRTGALLAALMLTRYEGWFIVGALLVLAGAAAPRRTLRLAWYPVTAVLAFLLLSWGSTGSWFVTGGFFEPNNPALGDAAMAFSQVIEGAARLGGRWLLWLGLAGALSCGAAAVASRNVAIAARHLLPLALAAAAALPFYAFFSGHPIRVRYMTALVVAAAAVGAFALARLPRRLHLPAVAAGLASGSRTDPETATGNCSPDGVAISRTEERADTRNAPEHLNARGEVLHILCHRCSGCQSEGRQDKYCQFFHHLFLTCKQQC
jgi:hypothetical protein